MRSAHFFRPSYFAILAIAVVSACSKSDSGTGPVTGDQLVFLAPPSQTPSGQAINPAIQVAIVDASGNVVPGATATVTIALAAPIPSGGALTGTLTATTVAGIATFANLMIGPVATGYTIAASAPGFTTITSGAFDVYAPMPAAATSIGVGGSWSCAITASGLFCWGHNGGGELGINSDTAFRTTPSAVMSGGHSYSQIAGGGSDNCALVTPGGAAQCWGHNFAGAAGDGTTDFGHRLVPVSVVGGHTFTTLSVGDDASCGLTGSGAMYCWGYNSRGQLGDGTTTNTSVPDSVHGGPYASISAGGSFACAVTAAGAAYCWGMNFGGNLGDGTFADKLLPVAVSGGLVFSSVKAGGMQTCGLIASTGAAYCWGDNAYGEVGDGTNFTRSVPTAVSGGLFFSSIVTGSDFTCGIQKTTGAAYCWGHNDVGQLGNGTVVDATAPVLVSGGYNFSQLGAGYSHACGLVSGTGAVVCWGNNIQGALGNGTTTDSHVPTAIVP